MLPGICLFRENEKHPDGDQDVFHFHVQRDGAGRGSRTPISSLARTHNNRYTIPARSLILRGNPINSSQRMQGVTFTEVFMKDF